MLQAWLHFFVLFFHVLGQAGLSPHDLDPLLKIDDSVTVGVVLLEDLLRHLVADLILEGVLERHGLL